MRAIVLKEFQELRRDRRTLALLIVMPLLLLVIFGYAANFTVDHLSVAVYGSEATTGGRGKDAGTMGLWASRRAGSGKGRPGGASRGVGIGSHRA